MKSAVLRFEACASDQSSAFEPSCAGQARRTCADRAAKHCLHGGDQRLRAESSSGRHRRQDGSKVSDQELGTLELKGGGESEGSEVKAPSRGSAGSVVLTNGPRSLYGSLQQLKSPLAPCRHWYQVKSNTV